MAVIGHDTPDAHARFGRSADRLARGDELDALVAGWIGARPADDVVAALVDARIPVSPVNDLADVVDDGHVVARGSITAGWDENVSGDAGSIHRVAMNVPWG